ncbi:uncharacterized protein LOC115815876 [Chanos chanos]|uniref:Uncharacterized protein LOC115815876 n=1 Tax=Chanos chanos TaxID=29144 RepID=A0A6J2VRQ1_CHACN|nr:uncharacterized protein LOC115815876 [Chanos chanos]
MLTLEKTNSKEEQDEGHFDLHTLCSVFKRLCMMNYSSVAVRSELDVYEDLWETNKDIATRTLNSDFLKLMQHGSLKAERYINFTLQDINYVLKVTQMLKTMSEKVKVPEDLSSFLQGRYKSYKSFADSLLNQYFLKDVPAIKPTPAMAQYLSDYRNTMKKDPIYFAVALLPCSRLWVWLAQKAAIEPNNAYYNWKKDNMYGHPEKHYKALLNKYLDTPEKVTEANKIFRRQMRNEYNFFASS